MYTDLSATEFTDIPIEPFLFKKQDCGLASYSIVGLGASIVDDNVVRVTSNVAAILNFNLVVTAIGNNPATKTIATEIKIVDCSSDNTISGGSWVTSRLYTDKTFSITTDLVIAPFTYSKEDCGLYKYSISPPTSAVSIENNSVVRFVSNIEYNLQFNLVVTAIGNTPATLSIPTNIQVVDCSNGNVITGGTWETLKIYTELTTL